MTLELSLEQFQSINRKRTEGEEEELKKLRLMLKKFWQKVYPNLEYEFFLSGYSNIGYFENIGFYVEVDASSDDKIINTYGNDLEGAFVSIIKAVLLEYSMDYENKNRKELQTNFETRFKGIKYAQGLYFAEYALEKWNQYYEDNIPDLIIEHYENYLNTCFKRGDDMVWSYNREENKFVYKEKDKVKEMPGITS